MKKIQKRLFFTITTILIILCCTTIVSADTISNGKCGNNINWTLDSMGTLSLNGSGTMYDYNSIYDDDGTPPWYRNAYDIKKIVIEEGITNIGSGAFYNCKNLTEVHLPSTLNKISSTSFQECTAIKKLYITDLTSYLNATNGSIGSGYSLLYINGVLAEEINIPDGITKINGLGGISSIKKVVIPKSVTEIYFDAFPECYNLNEVVIEGNPKGYWSSFLGCPLQSVIAPNLDVNNMNMFQYTSLITSDHTTSSVKVSWGQYPNIEKIGIYNSGRLIAEFKPYEQTSYTLKKNSGTGGSYFVRFFYDDGVSPELKYFDSSENYVIYKPYKTTVSKLTTGSKYVKVAWKENKSSMMVAGYQVQIATNPKFTSGKKTYTITDANKLYKKITNLNKNKKYYVRVRAYAEEESGRWNPISKKIYGNWSNTSSITCK